MWRFFLTRSFTLLLSPALSHSTFLFFCQFDCHLTLILIYLSIYLLLLFLGWKVEELKNDQNLFRLEATFMQLEKREMQRWMDGEAVYFIIIDHIAQTKIVSKATFYSRSRILSMFGIVNKVKRSWQTETEKCGGTWMKIDKRKKNVHFAFIWWKIYSQIFFISNQNEWFFWC